MKFILVIWVCSFIEGNVCVPPMESKQLFDSWYECSVAAHKESIKLHQKMGFKYVNEYKVGTKYYCRPTKAL